MDEKNKIPEIIRRLRKEYPNAKTALNFHTPFELLVATILSAQTTDVHVNRVTEKLFKKYSSPKEYAELPVEKLTSEISSVNFFNNKARSIHAAANMIVEKFNAKVPMTMEELVELPGVARKTANIVLYNAFGINEGIAVDTHVKRVAFRLGITKNQDAVKIEKDLIAITPKKEWGNLTHLLISHGRKICRANKPKHSECVLYDICPSRDI